MSSPDGKEYTDREELLINRIHELEDMCKIQHEALISALETQEYYCNDREEDPATDTECNNIRKAIQKYKELNDDVL